ncbi:MAG: 3-isopropylmalate dehydratase large subunit [Acetobacteraceae bacterium]|nr:3-isopropylmalate dehydratase large subunit [Acetobacteraceae bacterium]
MALPRTLFDKVFDAHTVLTREDGQALLYVDLHLCHEGSFHAFNALRAGGHRLRRPDRTIGVADHYVPTDARTTKAIANPEIRGIIETFRANMHDHGLRHFDIDDPLQGIVHVIGPELGLTRPGMLIVCGDSHTSTHGALGALAFGIGASEVAHVFATQTLWQARPPVMRVAFSGRLAAPVSAKDAALALIASIGTGGGAGHAIEFAGEAVAAMSVEQRLTLCNMAIEAGARCGMVAPDATTLAYLAGRPGAPAGPDPAWAMLASDHGAAFDREESLDAGLVEPMATWGTSPEEAVPVSAAIPAPEATRDAAAARRSLEYMGLAAGTRMAEVAVDRVFIGSCTNSRIEDLRAAAAVLRGRKARVPAMVSPGSSSVKRAAEAEGLDRLFAEAGFAWRDSGCSLCVAMNGDTAAAGERVASTSNRNFPGRQGRGARTHLMSPASAAAAAITGRIADVRELA